MSRAVFIFFILSRHDSSFVYVYGIAGVRYYFVSIKCRPYQSWAPASRFALTRHRVIDAKAKNLGPDPGSKKAEVKPVM